MTQEEYDNIIGWLEVNFVLQKKLAITKSNIELCKERIIQLLPDTVSPDEVDNFMLGKIDIIDVLNSHNERIYK